MLVLGLAAVTLHSNVHVWPSITLYRLVLDFTSGLSIETIKIKRHILSQDYVVLQNTINCIYNYFKRKN